MPIVRHANVRSYFLKYTETVEGRGKLANAVMGPAKYILQSLQDPVMVKEHPEVIRYARIRIKDMAWIKSFMTGGEQYNQAEYDSLFTQIQEAIKAARESSVNP